MLWAQHLTFTPHACLCVKYTTPGTLETFINKITSWSHCASNPASLENLFRPWGQSPFSHCTIPVSLPSFWKIWVMKWLRTCVANVNKQRMPPWETDWSTIQGCWEQITNSSITAHTTWIIQEVKKSVYRMQPRPQLSIDGLYSRSCIACHAALSAHSVPSACGTPEAGGAPEGCSRVPAAKNQESLLNLQQRGFSCSSPDAEALCRVTR